MLKTSPEVEKFSCAANEKKRVQVHSAVHPRCLTGDALPWAPSLGTAQPHITQPCPRSQPCHGLFTLSRPVLTTQ